MIVEIVGVLPGADAVRVTGPWGCLDARWRSRSPAAVGERWMVEADTARVYDWTEIDTAPSGAPGLRRVDDELNLIVGKIVDLDANGVLTARCGDHLVTVQLVNYPAHVEPGGRIGLLVDDLQLWPYDPA